MLLPRAHAVPAVSCKEGLRHPVTLPSPFGDRDTFASGLVHGSPAVVADGQGWPCLDAHRVSPGAPKEAMRVWAPCSPRLCGQQNLLQYPGFRAICRCVHNGLLWQAEQQHRKCETGKHTTSDAMVCPWYTLVQSKLSGDVSAER